MGSTSRNIPQTDDGHQKFDDYVGLNKYGRHKDETGRWVSNNPEPPSAVKKFGEGRGRYVVEEKEKFNKERRPEAGYYLDQMLNEKFIMQGDGENVPVVSSFEEMRLNAKLLENIRSKGYVKPLPIQRATFSLVHAGYDVIGHAVTGGGKTAAFLIPIINYILVAKGKAGYVRNPHPYCIIISPTKELAEQLYEDTQDFANDLNCRAVLSFGEIPRKENVADIKKGCDILICTVGRLCDYLADFLKLDMLHFLVFDEADRLLQVQEFYNDLVEYLLPRCKKIPNVQKLLFSATDCADLETLKEDFLRSNATKIVVGTLNTVNRFVVQTVLQVEVDERRIALMKLIHDIYATGDNDGPPPKTIVFVNTKRLSTVIACYLSLKGYKAYPIHGNLTATLRREAIEALQSGDCNILVSTDVTARGLDIKDISHVINYEMPKRDTWASYVHRVGRTGRVGNIGCATTFFAPSVDSGMALILYRWLEINGQEIPDFLTQYARRQAEFEDLERVAKEEYERAVNESYMVDSDDEADV